MRYRWSANPAVFVGPLLNRRSNNVKLKQAHLQTSIYNGFFRNLYFFRSFLLYRNSAISLYDALIIVQFNKLIFYKRIIRYYFNWLSYNNYNYCKWSELTPYQIDEFNRKINRIILGKIIGFQFSHSHDIYISLN